MNLRAWMERKFDTLLNAALVRVGYASRVAALEDEQRSFAAGVEEQLAELRQRDTKDILPWLENLAVSLEEIRGHQTKDILPWLENQAAGLEEVRGRQTKDILPWLGNLQKAQDDMTDKVTRCYDDRYGDLGISYLSFENHFRGNESVIKNRVGIYLQHFERQNCRKILDIACGRGEMLELLLENGYEAMGIDLNPEMVAHCRSKGLPVEEGDVFKYLEGIPDGTFDGFFIGQLVEHLGGRNFIRLMRLCQRKLRKGGIMLLETLNPQNLVIFQSAFYIDLTHAYPIHPLVVDWLLKSDGWSWSVQVETACPDVDYAWMGVK